MLEGNLFTNSNGRVYKVIRHNVVKTIALLKPIKPTFEEAPYMIAKGFRPMADSWGQGVYDLTEIEANRIYFNL